MKDSFLILLICSATTYATAPQCETAVVIKPGIRNYTNSFDVEVQSFKEMLKRNKIFVDNTLFIQEAMTWYEWLYMMGPLKSGRTINLDMLRTFLEIQVDDQGNRILPKNSTSNYKLFMNGEITMDDGTVERLTKPLLISQRKDLAEIFLGEYPVIYLNFKDVKGHNDREIRHRIGGVLRQAFVQHKYMINVFRNTIKRNHTEDTNNLLEAFEYVLNNEEDELSFDCIPFLCEILYNHFKRKTILIYDDYDKPLTNILQLDDFPKTEVTKVAKTIENLTLWCFRENKNIRKAFLMGTFEPYRPPLAPWIGYSHKDLILEYIEPFTRFFGFSKTNVEYLFEKYNLPAGLSEQAHKWYENFISKQYNPFSIANFLNTKRATNYFVDREVEKVAASLLDTNFKTRKKVLKLLSKAYVKTIVDDARRRFRGEDIFELRPQTYNLSSSHDANETYTFIWYLIRKGYLSARVPKPNEKIISFMDSKIHYRIPNKEIATLMCTRMIRYYQRTYKISYKSLLDAATKLLQFANNQALSVTPLENSLTEIYRQSSSFFVHLFKRNVVVNETIENPFRAVFTCVLLKLQNLAEFEVDVFHRRYKNPDYVIFNNHSSQALILQINHHNEPIEKTLKSVENREPEILQKLNNPDTVARVVVLKIWPNLTAQIYPQINLATDYSSNLESDYRGVW